MTYTQHAILTLKKRSARSRPGGLGVWAPDLLPVGTAARLLRRATCRRGARRHGALRPPRRLETALVEVGPHACGHRSRSSLRRIAPPLAPIDDLLGARAPLQQQRRGSIRHDAERHGHGACRADAQRHSGAGRPLELISELILDRVATAKAAGQQRLRARALDGTGAGGSGGQLSVRPAAVGTAAVVDPRLEVCLGRDGGGLRRPRLLIASVCRPGDLLLRPSSALVRRVADSQAPRIDVHKISFRLAITSAPMRRPLLDRDLGHFRRNRSFSP
mmetsp:Transcript_13969/g.41436  ORF Transcript_13969/g.41436 Transcript_13969/m.41436 type:complete len:275 (-) Transcript_13969:167-991(-)